MKKCNVFFILGLCLVLASCNTSKSYVKKAVKYEQNELINDAMNYYALALDKKSDNIDAKIGLKRTAQQLVDEHLLTFDEAYDMGDDDRSVELYEEVLSFESRLRRYGVGITVSQARRQNYENAKNAFLSAKYEEGCNLLEAERFNEAELVLSEIVERNANYMEASEKLKTAVCEPYYRTAKEQMLAGKYRKAYQTIEMARSRYFSYRDMMDLSLECLEKGKVAIIIPPIKDKGKAGKQKMDGIYDYAVAMIRGINSPFIMLYESEDEAVDVANRLKLSMTANEYKYFCSMVNYEEKRGYQRKVGKRGSHEYTEYDKVTYNIATQSCRLSLNMTISLKNLKSGNTLFSNSDKKDLSDNVKYIVYGGDSSKLIKGYWRKFMQLTGEHEHIDDNEDANREMDNLINARRTLQSENEMASRLTYEFVSPFVSSIENYLDHE